MPRHSVAHELKGFETTAYCRCGYCCGWHWGAALGPLPLYVPFSYKRGKEAPAGWKLMDRVRGAVMGGGLGAAMGAYSILSGRAWLSPVKTMALAAQSGALMGGLVTPVSPYWSETNLSGHPYQGITATGVTPREPRPPLLSALSFRDPWRIPLRLVTFQWRARDGTIAADTDSYPFGTRMFVPDWGWGVVEDRGGAIQGEARLDLYHNHHQHALEWGRTHRLVKIVRQR